MALFVRVGAFLETLRNPANPRIMEFSVALDSSKAQLDAGILIFMVKVKLAPVIQAIVFRLQVGAEGVNVDEQNG